MPQHFSSGCQEHLASKPTFSVAAEPSPRDCFWNRFQKGREKNLPYQNGFRSTFYANDHSPLPEAAPRPGSSDATPALGGR